MSPSSHPPLGQAHSTPLTAGPMVGPIVVLVIIATGLMLLPAPAAAQTIAVAGSADADIRPTPAVDSPEVPVGESTDVVIVGTMGASADSGAEPRELSDSRSAEIRAERLATNDDKRIVVEATVRWHQASPLGDAAEARALNTDPPWPETVAGSLDVQVPNDGADATVERAPTAQPSIPDMGDPALADSGGAPIEDRAGAGILSGPYGDGLSAQVSPADTVADRLVLPVAFDPSVPFSPATIGGVGVGFLLGAGAYAAVRPGRRPERRWDQLVDRGDTDDASVPEPVDPTPEDDELLPDEVVVEGLLRSSDGRMKQSTIVRMTDWSKAKVSRLLSAMAEEGRVVKIRIGRENLICLDGWEPDAVRPTHPAGPRSPVG